MSIVRATDIRNLNTMRLDSIEPIDAESRHPKKSLAYRDDDPKEKVEYKDDDFQPKRDLKLDVKYPKFVTGADGSQLDYDADWSYMFNVNKKKY